MIIVIWWYQNPTFQRGNIIFKIEDDKKINLGRNQFNWIKLKDISFTRKHCYNIKRNGILYIKDLGSKFSSLQYIRNKYEIFINQN